MEFDELLQAMRQLSDLLLQYANFKGDEQELGDAGDIWLEARDLAREIFDFDEQR